VNPENIPKTAVTTPFKLYEFRFMSFELRNAAQMFQKFIDEVLHGLSYCYDYIDDILIASANEEEHKAHLQEVFSKLDAYGLRINPAKCILGRSKIQFLGYRVSTDGTRPPPEKVEAIKNFPKPETTKQLQQFLGTVSIAFIDSSQAQLETRQS